MAITTTGYQTPATSREGLKPSVYDKIILIGPDETPILSLIDTSDVKGIEHSWLTDTLAAQTHEERVASEVMAKNKIEGERAHIEDVNSFASEREQMSGAYHRTGDKIPARKDEPLLHAECSQRDYATKGSPAQTMTAREFATGEAGLDEDTAAKVVKELAQGKEKSDFVDADTYADIVKFKNFENQRDYARAYGEQIEAAKQSLESAREQSAVRYADTQRAINEYQKQGMSASATRELINAKFKPSADEINYTRAYNGGADVDPRLAGQGIFYALEKDIAAQAYTPEIYAARLKQRGFSDESAQAFTQAYAKKDINIAKDYANGKVAEAYEAQIQKQVASQIRAKNEASEISIKEKELSNDEGAYSQHAMIRPNETSIEQGGLKNDKLSVARERLVSKIDVEKLNSEQKSVYDVFIGNKDKITLQGRDLNDLYSLEQGSRNAGARKIMIKHSGVEKTGGLTDNELLNFMEVVRGGKIADDSFEQFDNKIRYAYDLNKNGVNFRVVIDEYNDGKKVFDYYSDRNFIDYSQKGNLVNEKEANGLRDSVSSIGDNASRAGGRQASNEQILRQGRRDTTNASQTKRPAAGDGQMEQRLAAKADGQTDAAAATKQVVEKQGGGNNEVAHRFTIDDAINAKLNFINENNLGKEGWLDKLNAVIKKYDLKEAETKNEFMGVMIRDRFKYGREFDFPSMKDVMPKISPLKPQYHEILNGAHKELNEILKNKTIPATREQNLKFHAANSNVHLGSGLVAGTLNSIDEDGNFSPERFAAGFLAGLVGGKAAAVGLRKMTPKLYNKILGAAEKMPQMANGNPRLLGKLYSNGKDVSLNSFAGEKAITANIGKLDQAKAMLGKGADEVEIWQKTGWFKDKDGAWKFEIGDSNARLNPGFQSGGRLGELLDHEELFKAYPELKDVRIVKIGDETPDGAALSVKDVAQREKRGIYNVAFNNKKSTIIRKDLDAIDEIIKFEKGEADYMAHGERKSGYGALHIQKHLDTQNNGWVTKQEYLDMGQMLRKSTMKEADDKRIYTYFNDEGVRFRVVIGIGKNKERVISFYSNRKPLKAGLSYNSQNYDGNLPLNDDIIAQNSTKGYYSPAKNEIGLSDLGDRSTLMHEVQHAIQEIEDFARGGDFNTVWNAAAKNIEKKYESELARLEKISNDAWGKHAPLQKEYIKLFDGGLKDTPEAQRLLKQMRAFSDEGYRADHEIRELRKAANAEQNAITEETLQENYRKIHGEVEARNVQNRLNLDGKAHPHETFDVNPNETIVSKEDGISYSRKIEEIKREHPNVERELDESIAAMRKESFNDSNFKAGLMGKFDTKEITTQELGKSVNLSDKQLAVLKNDIKNADFKVISDSKIYFDKIGKDGDKKRFFVDIAQNGSLRVDAYAKSQVDNIPVKQSALEELAGTGDAARLKNMSFEVKAAYRNELDRGY